MTPRSFCYKTVHTRSFFFSFSSLSSRVPAKLFELRTDSPIRIQRKVPVALGEKASRRFSGNIFVAGGKSPGAYRVNFCGCKRCPAILCNDGCFITRVCLSERSARARLSSRQDPIKGFILSMDGARWKKPTLNF